MTTDIARLQQEKKEAIRLTIAHERRRARDRISAEILNFDLFIKTLDPADPVTQKVADEWRLRVECLNSIYGEDD